MAILRIVLPRLLAFLLSLLAFPTQLVAQTKAKSATPSGPTTVLFAVQKFEAQVHMEPITIISAGKYSAPPLDDEAVSKKFTDNYFRSGRRYRLLFGGGDAGSVTVQKNVEPGCVGLVAEVAAETSVRLGGEVQALATNSEKLGSKESSRRAPTEEERTAVLELARIAYSQNRVSSSLIKKMKTLNLTATDVEHNGRFDFVGSFQIEAANYVVHSLFMVFEPSGESYKATLTWYHKGAEAEFADRRLVDVLDLDGDGIAEVIAEGHYYESNDYIIYKRRGGQWREVYTGGGGGC